MLYEELKKRNLPPLPETTDEMLDAVQREIYGYMPNVPLSVGFEKRSETVQDFCAGKATLSVIDVTVIAGERSHTFPFYASIPTSKGPHPFFICVNFRDNVPDKYIPTEEIIDSGFAILSFNYEDVTRDNGDFTDGLCALLYEDGKRAPHDAGKIAVWSYAARCVMDYAEGCDALDCTRATICGHSRLGKTALLTGAMDKRFALSYSNDSGCSGAAITRGKIGESISNICKTFPYWFCESYLTHKDSADTLPLDQHFLIGAIAPRYAYVASAEDDLWADPYSEMLSCVAASEAYERLGVRGFICEDRTPKATEKYHEGTVGYHIRHGHHYFSREDWKYLIEFINAKFN